MTSTSSSVLDTPLNNVNNVFFKIVKQNVAATLPSSFDTWFAPTETTAVNNAITALFTNRSTYPSWQDFINYITAHDGSTVAATVENDFVKGYRFALFTDPTTPALINTSLPPNQDFTILSANPSMTNPPVTASDIVTQFQNAFTFLSKNFPSTFAGTTVPEQLTPDLYKQIFLTFTARSILLQNSSLNNLPPAQTIFKNSQLVASYEELYDKYFPNSGLPASERFAVFTQLLKNFYNQEISKNGFFIPSNSFSDFSSFLQTTAASGTFSQQTTLVSMGASKTLILNDIFDLLVSMINTLQQTAAIQSDRLLLYTDWQNAYTKQIASIPVFTANDGTFPGEGNGNPSDSNFVTLRSELNQQNAAFQEKLTAERQVISDEAQTQQTAITQSTDAFQQQSNFASSILEQLSTILSSIYR